MNGTVLTVPIYEALTVRQPGVLALLIGRGLLAPGFALEERTVLIELKARRESIGAMGHDSYERHRGALRQVRWAA